MKFKELYTYIHRLLHKCIKSARFPSVFALFFLSCATALLILSLRLDASAASGAVDFHLAARLSPMLRQSASLTATLSVGGGALLEGMRKSA